MNAAKTVTQAQKLASAVSSARARCRGLHVALCVAHCALSVAWREAHGAWREARGALCEARCAWQVVHQRRCAMFQRVYAHCAVGEALYADTREAWVQPERGALCIEREATSQLESPLSPARLCARPQREPGITCRCGGSQFVSQAGRGHTSEGHSLTTQLVRLCADTAAHAGSV